MAKAATAMNRSIGSTKQRLNNYAERQTQLGAASIAQGLAIAAPLVAATKAAMHYEDKMIDIRKQMAVDTPAAVKAMSQQVMALSKEIPLATDQLQELIASGLRMGIAENEIVSYTREVSKMSVAFDMAAGEIADQMGKIAGVYNIPIAQVGKFADVINYLDDNTKAKGPEIFDVLQRIGGSAKNLDPRFAAGLASAMLSFGETPERAGTSLSSMINTLSSATMKGAKFQEGLKLIGLSATDVQKRLSNKTTAGNTLMDILARIGKIDPSKQNEVLTRLFGLDHAPKLAKLVASQKEFNEIMAKSQSMQAAGSMDREFGKRKEAASAKVQVFKNNLTALSVSIGEHLIPMLTKGISVIIPFIERVGKFMQDNPGLTKTILVTVAAFSAFALVGGFARLVIGGFASGLSLLGTILLRTAQAIRFVITVVGYLSRILLANPILLLIAAIAFGVYMLIKHWDKVKAWWAKLWNGITTVVSRVITATKNIFLSFHPLGLIIKHWAVIKPWLSNLPKMFLDAGKNIVNSIVSGMVGMATKPVETMRKIVGKIRNLLPFSPAKDGPLKDIHRIRLVETIASSLTAKPLQNAMGKVLNTTFNTGGGPKMAVAGAGTGGGGMVFSPTINLYGSATSADAKTVADALKKEFENMYNQLMAKRSRVNL